MLNAEQQKYIIRQELAEFLPRITAEVARVVGALQQTPPPEWVKVKKAAELLGTTPAALNQRRYKGWYKEGRDFKKVSDKMVLYNTAALLKGGVDDKRS